MRLYTPPGWHVNYPGRDGEDTKMSPAELDTLIAEHVMEGLAQAYSTDPAAADYLRSRLLETPHVKIRIDGKHYDQDYVSITTPDHTQMPEGVTLHDAPAIWGDTWMQALCFAALVHVGLWTPDECNLQRKALYQWQAENE